MPDLFDPPIDHVGVGAGGGEHRGRVDEDAEVPDHVRGPGAGCDLEQPAQPAPVERLDLGRRQPDQQAVRRGGDRPGVGQLGELVPLPRVGTPDPGRGQPGELGRRRPAQRGRAVRAGRGPPEVGGERGQRQPAGGGAGHVLDADVVAGQLGQEPGRPFLAVVAARCGDHQMPAGPGDRDVEQPAFLVEQLGREGGGHGIGAGARHQHPGRRVHELVHAEQGRAHPQVGPDALLDPGHHDDIPLQALGPVRGQDPDGIALRCVVREGVARDLLAGHAVQEQGGRARRQPHREPGGGVEQRAHRVEVAVGRGAAGSAGRGGRLPYGREAGGVPDGPEHVVRVALRRGLSRERQQVSHPPGGVRGAGTDQGQLARVAQDGGQRLPVKGGWGGGWGLTGVVRRRPQRPAEPAQPQGVGAAERPGEQFYRRLLVEDLRMQRAAQQQEQRAHPGLGLQRQFVARDDRGHPGGRECPAQQRHLADDRPDQDRHGRPGHPVVQVGPAERIGHHRGLLAGAGGDHDPDRPGRGGRQRPQITMTAPRLAATWPVTALAVAGLAGRRDRRGRRRRAQRRGGRGGEPGRDPA